MAINVAIPALRGGFRNFIISEAMPDFGSEVLSTMRKSMQMVPRSLKLRWKRSIPSGKLVGRLKPLRGDHHPKGGFRHFSCGHWFNSLLSQRRPCAIVATDFWTPFLAQHYFRLPQAVGQIAIKRSPVRSNFEFRLFRSELRARRRE